MLKFCAGLMKMQLKKLIEWCKQGPPKAEVEDLIVKDVKPNAKYLKIFQYYIE